MFRASMLALPLLALLAANAACSTVRPSVVAEPPDTSLAEQHAGRMLERLRQPYLFVEGEVSQWDLLEATNGSIPQMVRIKIVSHMAPGLLRSEFKDADGKTLYSVLLDRGGTFHESVPGADPACQPLSYPAPEPYGTDSVQLAPPVIACAVGSYIFTWAGDSPGPRPEFFASIITEGVYFGEQKYGGEMCHVYGRYSAVATQTLWLDRTFMPVRWDTLQTPTSILRSRSLRITAREAPPDGVWEPLQPAAVAQIPRADS